LSHSRHFAAIEPSIGARKKLIFIGAESMKYKQGDRVKHSSLPEWGIGEVLEDSAEDKVRVFFVGVGEKTLSLKYTQPKHLTDEEAGHPLLDNLRLPGNGTTRYLSLKDAIECFLKEYPGGFYGERFDRAERDYKEQAHDLALSLLNKPEMNALLDQQGYDEVCRRARKIMNATNLVFPQEKMALKDGLKKEGDKDLFAKNLFEMLHGTRELEFRFGKFAETLERIGANKWTIASYFQFILYPDRYGFVKPKMVSHAAEISAFELNYRTELNWRTYKTVLAFYDYLKTELAELKPRDMIDVQSFMWCIADRN
jgi:hypothetical protein